MAQLIVGVWLNELKINTTLQAVSNWRPPLFHSSRLSFLRLSVENENHCDFVKLREMLICVNMEDLREQTHARHYELYRRCKLEEMGFKDTGPECKPVR